jgi:5-methyltetrahydrofolate--homocysteine methyltransferase
MLSVTIVDKSGRTLSGQTLEAFWTSVRTRGRSASASTARSARGRCARTWRSSRIADAPVTCYPNAGLPNAFGEYDETPETTAALLAEFADEG